MKNDQRGIYLPIPDEDDAGNLKTKRGKKNTMFLRPYLTLILIFSLISILLVIGMFMFSINSKSRDEYAIKSSKSANVPTLILISIDGFRYDYLKRGITPNLIKLCKKGIHGSMKPQFPSYTFPNHYSIVTGLYPESHGIVANSFYDPELDDYFSFTDSKNLQESKWWQAEPIWNTIQRFGMKSATMFWPGSESKIFGKRPNYYRKYNDKVSTGSRVDQILKWLDLPKDKKPDFISMYMSVVDDTGHLYGPESKEVNDSLVEVDSGIGKLMAGLKGRGIEDSVNLIIVSDHGMVEIKKDDNFHIYLDDLIPRMNDRLQWVDFGPMASIIPLPNEEESIFSELKEAQMHGHPFMVYKRNEIPTEFHYNENVRIAPIIVMAKKGYVFDYRGGKWAPRGAHGYDPNLSEMQALLIAIGPQFRNNHHSAGRHINRPIKGISNLDVYPLMMHLLKLTPAPNNGTMALVNLIE